MPAQILTSDDLREFKVELLEELIRLIDDQEIKPLPKRWLKSPEVRKLLGISPGTLQNLRINGSLPYSKFGGSLYYDYEDIEKILIANKKQNRLF
jgi:hypothetical protein